MKGKIAMATVGIWGTTYQQNKSLAGSGHSTLRTGPSYQFSTWAILRDLSLKRKQGYWTLTLTRQQRNASIHLESAQVPLTSTQYHPPTRHICTHATGHGDRDPEERIAYLVRKWILAEANIPVDAEYLGTKFVSGDK